MSCCRKKETTALPEPSSIGVEEALKVYYKAKLLPIERAYIFDQFHGPSIADAEFDMKPTVMCVGQYSTGKTTLINYLLDQEYPGSRVGPEPTTDRFVVCVHGDNVREIPGTTLVQDEGFPFQSLHIFGGTFLSKLSCATLPSALLEHITFIDTPGVLTGDKQRANRGYEFEEVVRFLADKVDRIILLFDTSKLDISDEFKTVIQALHGNQEKVKIILNKADAVSSTELIRVRGALMFNLGKVLHTPEVPKVFIGSFHKGKLKNPELAHAFAEDYKDLLGDFTHLPKTVKVRKINDVAKRAKALRSHILVMDMVKRRCSGSTPKAVEKATSKAHMLTVYETVQRTHRIPDADMPIVEVFVAKARASDPKKWRKLDPKSLAMLTEFLEKDISRIIRALPPDDQIRLAEINRPPPAIESPPEVEPKEKEKKEVEKKEEVPNVEKQESKQTVVRVKSEGPTQITAASSTDVATALTQPSSVKDLSTKPKTESDKLYMNLNHVN